MARRTEIDDRQANFFGVPAAEADAVESRPARQTRDKPATKSQLPAQESQTAPEHESLDALAARLSPAELHELVAALSDDVLAHLIIVTVRQLRRRLVKGGRQAHGDRHPTLERAARQLVAELGEQGGDEDAWQD